MFVLKRERFYTVLFILKKPYFSIFHTNYLKNISLPHRVLAANLGWQQEN